MDWVISIVFGPVLIFGAIAIVVYSIFYASKAVWWWVLVPLYSAWLFVTSPVRRILEKGVHTKADRWVYNGILAMLVGMSWLALADAFHGMVF